MAYFIGEGCVGCGACARACPLYAVDGAPRERHVINPRRCVDCGVCAMSCPAGAVSDGEGRVGERIPPGKRPRPRIDAARCSACRLCVDICRAGALSITPPRFRGDIDAVSVLAAPEKCVGCGLCEAECPMRAITMEAAL